MLLADEKTQLKFWIKTSQGTFGPYETRSLAESASLTVPRMLNEVPQILERTADGKQLLLG